MRQSKTITLVFTVFVLLTLTNCRWGQFRFAPNHSGQNAVDQSTPASAGTLGPAGNYDTTVISDINSSPAVDVFVKWNGWLPQVSTLVFFSDDQIGVYAFDVSAHTKRWGYGTNGGVYSSPAVDSAVVYVTDYLNLYALSEDTGALLWQGAVTQADYSSPTVANGVVYV